MFPIGYLINGYTCCLLNFVWAGGDYENALLYSDSVLMDLKKSNNLGGYIYFLKNKALIFEKKEQPEEAFRIYQRVNTLSDSVNVARYLHQLNELHLTYRIDQTQLDTGSRIQSSVELDRFFLFFTVADSDCRCRYTQAEKPDFKALPETPGGGNGKSGTVYSIEKFISVEYES